MHVQASWVYHLGSIMHWRDERMKSASRVVSQEVQDAKVGAEQVEQGCTQDIIIYVCIIYFGI